MAHSLWVDHGRSAPVAMDVQTIQVTAPIPGDINGDGQVDGSDLTILLGNWGPCAGCPADINGDGQVDGSDLTILLGNWGS